MNGLKIFIVAVILYGVSIFGGFIQDDTRIIENDPQMGRVDALFASFLRPYYYMSEGNAGAYRPLTSFSLYLNALITGKEAWGFHLMNVLMYGGVCFLVFKLLKNYFSLNVAFWGSILFLVLPIHTEAVNNIVGRGEILSLGFVILAVLMQIEKKWELSAGMLFLGLLSKETSVVGIPLLIYLLILGKEKKDIKIGVSFFYVFVVLSYLILRFAVLGGGLSNTASIVENPLKFVGTEQRIMNAFALVPLGVSKIIFPVNLSYDYSFNQLKLISNWFDWRVLLGISLTFVSLGSLFTCLRKNAIWIIGQCLFWGPMVITGNFLFPIGTIFGERLWFWTSLGVVMMIASIFSFRSYSLLASDNSDSPAESDYLDSRFEFPLRGTKQFKSAKRGTKNKYFKGLFISAIVIVLLYAGRTFVRNINWLSQDKLFIHDVRYAKDSVMAQSNAAAMYLIRLDFVKGREYLENADKIYSLYPQLMNNWGMYYLWTGDTQMAKEKFELCLKQIRSYYLCESNLDLINK